MSSSNKKKSKTLEEIKKNADNAIKTGAKFTKIASDKIDESVKNEIQKAKANPKFNELKFKTAKATKSGLKKSKQVQEKSPSIIKKYGKKLRLTFEKFIGTITRGTQYGKTSIDMLEQLAKMKELGIITNKEFEKKKKEILDRI